MAILEQAQARYDAMQTCWASGISVTAHNSTIVVDVNELRKILPPNCLNILDSEEFDRALTDENVWRKNFRMVLTRPEAFLIEGVQVIGSTEITSAMWYESGLYHVMSDGRGQVYDAPPFGAVGEPDIPMMFYNRFGHLKFLKGLKAPRRRYP